MLCWDNDFIFSINGADNALLFLPYRIVASLWKELLAIKSAVGNSANSDNICFPWILGMLFQFLADELLLQINQRATRLDSIYNGVDFVGFIVRPFYMLCRRRVIGNMKSALRKYQQKLVEQTDQVRIWKYDRISLERLLATMNSYLDHLSHARTRNVIIKVCQDFSFLSEYYILTYRKLIRKYDYPKAFKNIRQQIRYFSSRFNNQIVLFQIGCYYESFGHSAEQLSQLLNYKLRKGCRGMSRACGFHQRFLNSVCCKLETDGISFAVIKQTGKYLKNIMERFPSFRVEIINNNNR